MRRSIRYLLAALVILPVLALGQKVGTSSMQFLKVMPTARATAMGDAFASLASGADAVFWNPAGLVQSDATEVVSTITMWLFDTQQGAVAFSTSLGDWGSLGVQLQYVDYGDIEETRVDQLAFVGVGADRHFNPGLTGNTYSPSTYLVGVTYAKQLTDKFSAGLTVKVAQESLFGSSTASVVVPVTGGGTVTESFTTYATAALFDFGMYYNTGFRSMKIGVSIQNFGPQVKFSEESFPAPLALRLGSSVDLIGAEGLMMGDSDNRLTLAYDIFQPNDYAQQMHFGLEYEFADLIALRAGYKSNYDNERWTYGGGLHSSVIGYRLAVDYSYAGMGTYLGNVHRISFGVTF